MCFTMLVRKRAVLIIINSISQLIRHHSITDFIFIRIFINYKLRFLYFRWDSHWESLSIKNLKKPKKTLASRRITGKKDNYIFFTNSE
jgi:hypothetical protein